MKGLHRWLGVAVGLAALGWLAGQVDRAALQAALREAGVPALGAMVAWHLAPLLADTLGWRRLLGDAPQPSLARLLLLRWIGESASALLPVAQVGGDMLRARLHTWHGIAASRAGAAVAVDVALTAASQVPFALLGVALAAGGANQAAWLVLCGVVLTGGYVLLGRRPLAWLAPRLVRGAAYWRYPGASALRSFSVALAACMHAPDALRQGFSWHLLAWLLGAGEIYLALQLLGQPLSLADAMLIEALLQALRSAAFFVPAAIGVQEGGLLALVALVGLPTEVGAALAVLRRGRELALGAPGLIAWQVLELRHAARRGGS